MAPLEEGDDGYGVRYNSMFSRAANGDESASNTTSSRFGDELDDDGVSRQRRTAPFAPGSDEENSYEEMTMAEIMCGKGDHFPGLIPLVQAYLDHINCDSITRSRINAYLDFIEKKATGELVTTATWMRSYVRNHPAYGGDSVVSDEIAYDLVKLCADIGLGNVHIPELLGDIKIDPVTTEGAYEIKLDSKRAQNARVLELLQRYKTRNSFKSVAKAAGGGRR
jgi:glutamate--cysteine ligase catalytic subunit